MGEPRAEGREFGRAGRTARGVERIFGAILDIVAAIGAAEIDVPARSLAAKAAGELEVGFLQRVVRREAVGIDLDDVLVARSEEHTSELQSLMRISYAVFCLKKKKKYEIKLTNTNDKIQI